MSAEDVVAHLGDRPGLVWLDGGASGRSVVAWDPSDVRVDPDPWPGVGRGLTRGTARPDGFSGVVGYIGHGAGHQVEDVPPEAPTPEPTAWLARVDGALVWEPGAVAPVISGSPGFQRDARALLARGPAAPPEDVRARASRSVDPAQHASAIARIQAWIAAGDCYQVNLTRPVWVEDAGPPLDAYRRLRRASDASMGAYLRLDADTALLSNSPETLLTASGRALTSVPIKGTRPRHVDPAVDASLRAELLASAKDHAELAMIVDLVRNDLGRVAVPGSVLAGERVLTSHATVHHASWAVRAVLRDDRDVWDALAALFPPGSVTGAPKVRACHRIAQVEPVPRGVAYGAIGFVADGGDAAWSVAIRTAVWHRGSVRWHVGGGIVADSDPASEWDETVHKGAALARAFGAS